MSEIIVITALDQAINDAHERAMKAFRRTEEALLEFANQIIGCGTLLLEKRKRVAHKGWCNLFKTWKGKDCEGAIFQFDHSTGHRYMRVANRHPQPFRSWLEAAPFLKDAGIIAKALPEPSGHGNQHRHEITFSIAWLDFIGEVNTRCAKYPFGQTICGLDEHGKQLARDQLKPAKERIDELWGMLQ